MNKIYEVLKENNLNCKTIECTSIEMLENMNKLNLIRNQKVSEGRMAQMWLSMSLRDDESVRKFASEFCGNDEKVDNFNLATFFAEFEKVCKAQEGKAVEPINKDYEVIISKIIESSKESDEAESIRKTIEDEIHEGKLIVPTVGDYLRVAEIENKMVKEKNQDLESLSLGDENLLGNEKDGYKKFETNQYMNQIYNITNGFKIRGEFMNYENLTKSNLKTLSRFTNIKTSSTQRIINKTGGKGYLSSPTRERGVKYYTSNIRIFGKGKDMMNVELSLNGVALYTLHDLNNRALKYKKGYIKNEIIQATGMVPTRSDVKVVASLVSDLATRYMLFGLDLNNTTKYDPNVLFDYRMESRFLNKLEDLIEDKNNTWILPLVQNLASNMAVEFFRNAGISEETLKNNLKNASKYLPEFDKDFSKNMSMTGILFNSEASTYDDDMLKSKAKKPDLSKNAESLASRTSFKKDDQPDLGNTEEPSVEKPEGFEPNAEQLQEVKGISVNLFGVEKNIKIFNMTEYCDNFIKNVLEPCAKDNVAYAKDILGKLAQTDETQPMKERLIATMGEETITKFYTDYVDYSKKQIVTRVGYCEKYVDDIKYKLLEKITVKIAIAAAGEENKENPSKYLELFDMVKNDKSLSDNEMLRDAFDPLIDAIVASAKEKTANASLNDEKILDKNCVDFTGKTVDEFLDEFLAQVNTMEIQAENALPAGSETLLLAGPEEAKNLSPVALSYVEMFNKITDEALDKDSKCAYANSSNGNEYFVKTVLRDENENIIGIDFSSSRIKREEDMEKAGMEKEFRELLKDVYQTKSYEELQDLYVFDEDSMTIEDQLANKIYTLRNSYCEKMEKATNDSSITEEEMAKLQEKYAFEYESNLIDLIKDHSDKYVAEKNFEKNQEEKDKNLDLGRKATNIKTLLKRRYAKHFEEHAAYLSTLKENVSDYNARKNIVVELDAVTAERRNATYEVGIATFQSLANRFNAKNTYTLEHASADLLKVMQSDIMDKIEEFRKTMKDKPEYYQMTAEEIVDRFVSDEQIEKVIGACVNLRLKGAVKQAFKMGEEKETANDDKKNERARHDAKMTPVESKKDNLVVVEPAHVVIPDMGQESASNENSGSVIILGLAEDREQ